MKKEKNVFFYKKYFFIIKTIFFIDLISKKYIVKNFKLNENKEILHFLSFFYVKNYGIAFGLFPKYKNILIWMLLIINILIITTVIKKIKKLKNIGYILIISGSLGNLFDRLYYGYIIDFIDIHIKNYHFITFNISDISILTGIIKIILYFK